MSAYHSRAKASPYVVSCQSLPYEVSWYKLREHESSNFSVYQMKMKLIFLQLVGGRKFLNSVFLT
jgi:hypothetical protein